MKILTSLFAWLLKLSQNKLAQSNPGPLPCNPNPHYTPHDRVQPIEISTEKDVTLGINLALGQQDSAAFGPNGELIRSRRNVSILLSCGHIATQIRPVNKPGEQAITVALLVLGFVVIWNILRKDQ